MGFDRKGQVSASSDDSLAELRELAATAGATVVHSVVQARETARAATLIGTGKIDELKRDAEAFEADLVVFNHELSPTQQRNLEKALDRKVIDRTQLILDIFASRARTREGRLQVELAQLSYILPRLSGQGVSLSRLGGGIGTRGPGETKLETDRRRISKRIKKLEDDLEQVRSSRGLHRSRRQAVPLPTLALVGYTNAGKSTLFNRITSATVMADARMFATLDPTVRGVTLPSRRRVLMSDTVGFIRNLPTTLIDAFRATLEEVGEATLVLHVVDAASPHAAAQTAHVLAVLCEIEASETPQVLVLNKCDLLSAEDRDVVVLRHRMLGDSGGKPEPRAVMVAGQTGEGILSLLELIDSLLTFDPVTAELFEIPQTDTAAIALLHEYGRVGKISYAENLCFVEADVSESLRRRLSRFIVAGSV